MSFLSSECTGYPVDESLDAVHVRGLISGCHQKAFQIKCKFQKCINNVRWLTSSISGESLANWEDEDECGIMEFVKQPLSRLEMKYEVGAEPLQTSAWTVMLCCVGEFLLQLSFEFSSSIRFVNSSILSFSDDICSESWVINPYKLKLHLLSYNEDSKTVTTKYEREQTRTSLAGESWFLSSYLLSLEE